jgi:hypothetical protein
LIACDPAQAAAQAAGAPVSRAFCSPCCAALALGGILDGQGPESDAVRCAVRPQQPGTAPAWPTSSRSSALPAAAAAGQPLLHRPLAGEQQHPAHSSSASASNPPPPTPPRPTPHLQLLHQGRLLLLGLRLGGLQELHKAGEHLVAGPGGRRAGSGPVRALGAAARARGGWYASTRQPAALANVARATARPGFEQGAGGRLRRLTRQPARPSGRQAGGTSPPATRRSCPSRA